MYWLFTKFVHLLNRKNHNSFYHFYDKEAKIEGKKVNLMQKKNVRIENICT